MANPYLGQLMLAGFNFAPRGYAACSGQLLPISQYTALFSLLGTYYGGNGTSNFGLPNLQGNVAVGYGQASGLSPYSIGQLGGSSTETLNTSEVPSHTHLAQATATVAEAIVPTGNSFARSEGGSVYNNTTAPPPATTQMSSGALTPFNGGSQPHNNMMPFLALNWVIALTGVYPPRS